MKLLSYALLMSVFLLAFSSCQSGPESTAEEFVNALAQDDFEAAKKLANFRTQTLLDLLHTTNALKGLGKDADQIYQDEIDKTARADVHLDCTCEQVKDIAKCTCRLDKEDLPSIQLILNKEDGAWIVDLPKNQDN